MSTKINSKMKALLTVVALGLISIGFVDCTKKSNTPPEPKKYTITKNGYLKKNLSEKKDNIVPLFIIFNTNKK